MVIAATDGFWSHVGKKLITKTVKEVLRMQNVEKSSQILSDRLTSLARQNWVKVR